MSLLTELVPAGVVRDLEDVERDAIDAGLAECVEPGDVRAFVVNMLKHRSQFSVVVMLKLDLEIVPKTGSI